MSVAAGQAAEKAAADFLRQRGLRIATTNYRCRRGEIDIVAEDGAILVFVEVRQRKRWKDAAESVDFHKQRRLTAAASHYLSEGGERDCRFDVVLIAEDGAIKWMQNAFEAGEN